tara:strand:+ start:53 stop:790 length:738 start_codon:yes stop_codon:yes gene_type:complete
MAESGNEGFTQGEQWLERRGFNLRAVLDVGAFPSDLASAWDATGIPRIPGQRLVMLGMGGFALWDWMTTQDLSNEADPFDAVSRRVALEVAERFWGDPIPRLLYPGDALIPLQQLGRWAGWSVPSPLGLDVSPVFGLWFAFRVAMLTLADLPFSERRPTMSPCDTCDDQPCIQACPVGAVRKKEVFDRQRCQEKRFEDQFGCGIKCHSRLACPIGIKWRYPQRQLHYHGERSLRGLLALKNASGG